MSHLLNSNIGIDSFENKLELSRATLEFQVQVLILILVKSQVNLMAQLTSWYFQEFNLD